MDYGKRGFTVVEVPPVADDVLAAFETLPLDPYCGGEFRYRRFSQYRLSASDGRWTLTLLPHRQALQARDINRLTGGMPRDFEPLQFDPTPQVAAGARAAGFDPERSYQVNVHQIRVIANDSIQGTTVPEGPHRDGHAVVMVLVVRRDGVSGGVTQLMPTGGGKPFFETLLHPNEAIVFDDARMWHYTTDIVPVDEIATGFRDVFLVGMNPWQHRCYGSEFEQRATR